MSRFDASAAGQATVPMLAPHCSKGNYAFPKQSCEILPQASTHFCQDKTNRTESLTLFGCSDNQFTA